jgi:DNA-binding HxlR family transcriptional regulator
MIASALDVIGDKWSLLIVRDMLMHQKKTFKEFASSDERVASNLLSSRLKLLQSLDIISKSKSTGNKKENIYLLTHRGLDLAPMILELALWSNKHIREYNSDMNAFVIVESNKKNKIETVQINYLEFSRQFKINN